MPKTKGIASPVAHIHASDVNFVRDGAACLTWHAIQGQWDGASPYLLLQIDPMTAACSHIVILPDEHEKQQPRTVVILCSHLLAAGGRRWPCCRMQLHSWQVLRVACTSCCAFTACFILKRRRDVAAR